MMEIGYILILATLIQAVIMSLLLIVTPLFLLKRIQRKSGYKSKSLRLAESIGPLIFFGCIGLGFMFFEMVFISKFTLFLSHPVYAATVVLAAVLIFAGAGSFYIKRFSAASPGFLWIPVLAILGWVLVSLGIGDKIFDWGLKFPFGVRLMIIVLWLLLPAFFLGWLFPSGLRMLAHKHPDLIPWAWGVNGCASVIGAVLGKCLAVTLGFHSVMMIASLLYIMAVASFHIAYRPLSPFLKVE